MGAATAILSIRIYLERESRGKKFFVHAVVPRSFSLFECYSGREGRSVGRRGSQFANIAALASALWFTSLPFFSSLLLDANCVAAHRRERCPRLIIRRSIKKMGRKRVMPLSYIQQKKAMVLRRPRKSNVALRLILGVQQCVAVHFRFLDGGFERGNSTILPSSTLGARWKERKKEGRFGACGSKWILSRFQGGVFSEAEMSSSSSSHTSLD